MEEYLAAKVFGSGTGITLALGSPAQVHYCPDIKCVDCTKIGRARPHMLTRPPEQALAHCTSALCLPSAIVAEVVNAFSFEKGCENHDRRLTARRAGRKPLPTSRSLSSVLFRRNRVQIIEEIFGPLLNVVVADGTDQLLVTLFAFG